MQCGLVETRAAAAGYTLDNTLCELCGAEEDTIHHRIWRCQPLPVKQAREKAATRTFIDTAIAAGPHDPIYNRGLFKHPDREWPAAETEVQMTSCCAQGAATSAGNLRLQGHCFTDGSSDRHVIKDCGRAGWSAVQTDENGKMIAAVWGPVPAQLPQSPQAAEHSAFTMLLMLLGGIATAGCDCANVIRSWRGASQLRKT